jgi:DNA-binding GntR family transcriptional regulator
MATVDPEPGAALSEVLAEEIHRRILSGEIPVGSWLRQDALATEFEVSRMPVREAFRILGGRGVLELVPRRGALVQGPTPRDIRESHEVRAELEGYAAELAADRIDRVQVAELAELADAFDEIAAGALEADGDADPAELGARWASVNDRFHALILEAADNSHLTVSVQELRRRVPHNTTFSVIAGNRRQLELNAADHRKIYEAIEAAEGAKARRLIRQHILRASELIARRFESDLGRDAAGR